LSRGFAFRSRVFRRQRAGHYFEIHEVEWRNRVKAKFGAEGREGSYRWMERSGPVEVTFVGCGAGSCRRRGKRKETPRDAASCAGTIAILHEPAESAASRYLNIYPGVRGN